MILAERTRKKRKEFNLTQEKLGKKIGKSRGTILRIEKGTWKGYLDTIIALAEFFNVDPNWLQGKEKKTSPLLKDDIKLTPVDIDFSDTIPLLTSLPAGHWLDWVDSYPPGEGEDRIPRYDVNGAHVIAIRVEGESMMPDLLPGDVLIIDPEKSFTDVKGGIGVVKFKESFQIRKIYRRGDNYILEPSNKAYEAEIIPVTDTTIFRIMKMVRNM